MATSARDDIYGALTAAFPDYPIYKQGTMAENKPFPDDFITVFLSRSNYQDFFDNKPTANVYDVTVIFYSNNDTNLEEVPPQIIDALSDAGLTPQGDCYDTTSGEPSHDGRICEFIYYKEK